MREQTKREVEMLFGESEVTERSARERKRRERVRDERDRFTFGSAWRAVCNVWLRRDPRAVPVSCGPLIGTRPVKAARVSVFFIYHTQDEDRVVSVVLLLYVLYIRSTASGWTRAPLRAH